MKDVTKAPPTLRTVAELTGLSASTVSLCLRGGGSVRESTRERVLEAARRVGYVPNRAGVRLRTGRTNVLSLVLAADQNILDYTRLLIQGVGEQISGTRFHLNVVPEFVSADPVGPVRYILKNRAADGVILTHTTVRDPRVQLLMEAEFPFVCHGRTEFYTPHPFHDFHAERYVAMAVDRLVARGRRRILLALFDNGTTNYGFIASGFRRAMEAHGLDGRMIDGGVAFDTAAGAREAGRAMAGQADAPDGIVCNNELTAISLIAGLADGGRALGRDYELVCKQTTEILPTLYPKMDTVAEDLTDTGRELTRLLVRRIRGAAPEELQTFREPEPRWRSGPDGAASPA